MDVCHPLIVDSKRLKQASVTATWLGNLNFVFPNSFPSYKHIDVSGHCVQPLPTHERKDFFPYCECVKVFHTRVEAWTLWMLSVVIHAEHAILKWTRARKSRKKIKRQMCGRRKVDAKQSERERVWKFENAILSLHCCYILPLDLL